MADNKLLAKLGAPEIGAPGIERRPARHTVDIRTIDMAGDMDIEVGFVVKKPQAAEGQVQPGVQPAGRYAHLTYSRYALRGNQALSIWAKDNNIALDNNITPAGDAFACRYEAYLTDYQVEPRKTKWQVDLAIKLVDGP